MLKDHYNGNINNTLQHKENIYIASRYLKKEGRYRNLWGNR